MLVYAFELVVVLFASFVKGSLGFGLPLIAVPLLSSLLGPRETVIAFTLFNLIANVVLIVQLRRQRWESWLLWTLLALLAGSAIGAHIVEIVPEGVLSITVGGLTLVTLGLQRLLPKRSLTVAQTRLLGPIAGFAGGVMGGTTAIYSPLLAAFLQLAGVEADRFVFMLTVLFASGLTIQVVSFAAASLYTAPTLLLVLIGLPALFAGVWLGTRLRSRINPETFRRLIAVLLVLNSLNLIRSGLHIG